MFDDLLFVLGMLLGCISIYFLLPPYIRFIYEPKLHSLKEEVHHRYATLAVCISARADLLKRVEEANATYSQAEREYLKLYLSAMRAPNYYSIGVNSISPASTPAYNLTDRLRAVIEEMNKAAAAVAESRTAYDNAARQYNDELNGHAFKLYRLCKGQNLGRASYGPKDQDVISEHFKVFAE